MRRRVNRNVQSGLRKKSRAMSSTTARSIAVGGWARDGGLSPEKKFIDNSLSINPTAGANTFSAANVLNSLAEGASATTRIGRKIVMKSIYIRYSWEISTGLDGAPLRILVVYDKQPNAAAAAITAPLVSSAFNSLNNLSNRDRFVTLFDHITEPVDEGGPHAVGGVLYKSINLEAMFNDVNGGTIADITTGSILLYVAQQGSIITNAPTFVCRARIRFTDA